MRHRDDNVMPGCCSRRDAVRLFPRGDPSGMSLRRLVSLLAVFGVLMHAGLVVRHSAIMLKASLVQADAVRTVGHICHTDGAATALVSSKVDQQADSDAVGNSEPTGGQTDCPICDGAIAKAVVLPMCVVSIHAPDMASARVAVVGETVALRLAAAWPPSRGPPTAI
jgi:hypothetical protein